MALLMYLFADYFNRKFGFKNIGDGLWELEENLDNYWSALSSIDRKWFEKEEYHRRHALGMQMMTDEQYASLTNSKHKRKRQQGGRLYSTHTFDILANSYYVDHF